MADTAEFNFNVTLVDIRAVPVCPVKKVEVNEQLQSLMKRVSKDDRRMLKLLLIGHSIAAAARLLKVEPAALRMRLSRLRVRVRPRVAAADESKNAST
jgi:DNA-directed RNA polymerase specialized sigma24 family protein